MLLINNSQYGLRLWTFQNDGGEKFNNDEVEDILSASGIKFIITNQYCYEQNGCAERTNKTVDNLARTLILSKNLSKYLWAESVNTVVFLLNRTGPIERTEDSFWAFYL